MTIKLPPNVELTPMTPAFGAEIAGINLAQDAQTHAAFLKEALFSYGVIFLRQQQLDFQQHIALAQCFGEVEEHPIVEGMKDFPEIIKMHKPAGEAASFGVGWHSDNSFLAAPSLGSILFAETIPPVGGDTLFASQTAAYNHLSKPMQKLATSLRAVHTARDAYTSSTALEKYEGKAAMRYKNHPVLNEQTTHDVVISHPATGAKALYVNPMFTTHLEDLEEAESRALLDFFFAHARREEFQCRFRWEKGAVAIWDNRLVQHAALNDYQQFERIIYRVTVKGEPV